MRKGTCDSVAAFAFELVAKEPFETWLVAGIGLVTDEFTDSEAALELFAGLPGACR